WNTSVWAGTSLPSMSDDLTRGGPLMAYSTAWFGGFSFASNYAANVRWSANVSYTTNELRAHSLEGSATLGANVGERWTFSIEPTFGVSHTPRQYIATLGGGSEPTFGYRYIFAILDEHVLSAQLRAGCAITPSLSLDLYAEPFAASGTYYGF